VEKVVCSIGQTVGQSDFKIGRIIKGCNLLINSALASVLSA
jgi:hypothetical protein